MCKLEPISGANSLETKEKVKEAFNEDHSQLATDLYARSIAPNKYALFSTDQSGSTIRVHNSADESNSSTKTREDTLNLATKEKEGGVLEIVKKVAVVAGVALVGWGISKLLGELPSSERERKTMKAPGNDYRIIRDVFESNAKGYFKAEREKRKMARRL